MRFGLSGVLWLAGIGALPLEAATITQTASMQVSLLNAPGNFFLVPTPIKRFDPAFGKLNGIRIVLDGDYEFTASMVSTDALNACCVYGTFNFGFQFDEMGLYSPNYGATMPPWTEVNVISGSDAFEIDTGTLPVDQDIFSGNIVGEGLVPSFFYGNFWLFHEIDGTGVFTESGKARLHATVVYQYDPVPEPATWGMMLLGFATIGSARRWGRVSLVKP